MFVLSASVVARDESITEGERMGGGGSGKVVALLPPGLLTGLSFIFHPFLL